MPVVNGVNEDAYQDGVAALTPRESKRLRGRVKGDIDDDHVRAAGLVGRVVPVPAEYWGKEFAKKNRGKLFKLRLIAFVPAQDPSDDRWYFYDHFQRKGDAHEVCPIKASVLNKMGVRRRGQQAAQQVTQEKGKDESKQGGAERSGATRQRQKRAPQAEFDEEEAESEPECYDSDSDVGSTYSGYDCEYRSGSDTEEEDEEFDIDDGVWDKSYKAGDRDDLEYDGEELACGGGCFVNTTHSTPPTHPPKPTPHHRRDKSATSFVASSPGQGGRMAVPRSGTSSPCTSTQR